MWKKWYSCIPILCTVVGNVQVVACILCAHACAHTRARARAHTHTHTHLHSSCIICTFCLTTVVKQGKIPSYVCIFYFEEWRIYVNIKCKFERSQLQLSDTWHGCLLDGYCCFTATLVVSPRKWDSSFQGQGSLSRSWIMHEAAAGGAWERPEMSSVTSIFSASTIAQLWQ